MKYRITTETIQDQTFLTLKMYDPNPDRWYLVWGRKVTENREAYEQLFDYLDTLTLTHGSIELI